MGPLSRTNCSRSMLLAKVRHKPQVAPTIWYLTCTPHYRTRSVSIAITLLVPKVSTLIVLRARLRIVANVSAPSAFLMAMVFGHSVQAATQRDVRIRNTKQIDLQSNASRQRQSELCYTFLQQDAPLCAARTCTHHAWLWHTY